jgi:hypothetical protein
VPLTTATRLHAALLYAGRGAHLSGVTAARAHGIDARFPGRGIHIVVPQDRRVIAQPGLHIRRGVSLAGAQVLERGDGLRLTSAVRTVIDLGDVLARPELDVAVSDALRQGFVTVDYIRNQLPEVSRRRNVVRFRRMLDELDPTLESVLEAEFLALVSRTALPLPTSQYEVWDGPLLIARVDFAYAERRLAIEVDGYEFHSRYDRFQSDRARRRKLTELSWEVVEFTAEDIRRRPDAVIDVVRKLLAKAA